MIVSIINVTGDYRLSKGFQTEEEIENVTIALSLALLNIILARTNHLYNAAFLMQMQCMIHALITKSGFTHG